MCGIVGVLGHHEAAPILVEALKRLEYRGYDSAGIATVNGGVLDRRRAVGKLVNLQDLLVHDPLAGKSGIGHTRWVTHGAPNAANAHPHRAGGVAVVHNGIIENYLGLKERLEEEGCEFRTETDSEVIAHLVGREVENGADLASAVRKAMKLVEGGIEDQAHRVFQNLRAVCRAAGSNLDGIVKLNLYLADMGDFPAVNEVMKRYFEEPYPARAAIGVASLPRGAGIEMDAVMELENG